MGSKYILMDDQPDYLSTNPMTRWSDRQPNQGGHAAKLYADDELPGQTIEPAESLERIMLRRLGDASELFEKDRFTVNLAYCDMKIAQATADRYYDLLDRLAERNNVVNQSRVEVVPMPEKSEDAGMVVARLDSDMRKHVLSRLAEMDDQLRQR